MYCDSSIKNGRQYPQGGERTGSAAFFPGRWPGQWQMAVDAYFLRRGSSYMICIDLDGKFENYGFGDTLSARDRAGCGSLAGGRRSKHVT